MGQLSVKGRIIAINPSEQINEKLTKRTFVVETTEEQYPQTVIFEAVNDKAKQLDRFNVGSDVYVNFNLRGRAYTDKSGKTNYFNTLSAWSVGSTEPKEEVTPDSPDDEGDDDLPF